MNKNEIRKLILRKRESLSQEEVNSSSNIISNKLSGMDEFRSAQTVLFYYPIRNEVNLIELLKKSINQKTICLPFVEKKKRFMTARKISDFDTLKMGKYGIMSAPEGSRIIEPHEIDMVIVPMVVFDKDKNRIGYGGGYYDTYLCECNNAFWCGVAHSVQRYEKIMPDIHDLLLDVIVTENKTY